MKYIRLILILAILHGCKTGSQMTTAEGTYIAWTGAPEYLALVSKGKASPIWMSPGEYEGVNRALKDLQSDIGKVTGILPEIVNTGMGEESFTGQAGEIILAGTVGMNPLIDRLINESKLDVSRITGKWESSVTTVIDDPFPGVSKALVIAGSDKRGTIFGIYGCSEQLGVSPWHFWADVVPRQRDEIHAVPGTYLLGEPAVKYRGIFINDEAPALAGWVHENFGSFNHEFYEHVFELILRMKGNYLWPAMWGRAFYDDDSLNAPLADAYGVVIGTTHHEPLMRAHVEWSRYGTGPWDYRKNAETLRAFWREGIERMGNNESIVSLGMRGDGDEPMTEGTAISLLEEIVADQRSIIGGVTGKDPTETPQLWALYKEVQEYYDRGMRVPDDVTLLLCDDNWGNIRKLPQPGEPERKGGYGIYYHFDYVGGPRNYKWLNTTQIERVWEQMHLAHRYGANRIWIVNVGDIKPMEFPIQFFLEMAWEPGKFSPANLPDYYSRWAEKQFGTEFGIEIGDILKKYTKFNSRRKPELLSPDTYSLIHYREAEQVVDEYNELARRAEELSDKIPENLQDAYYQLVLFPVKACANLNDLYVSAAKNRLYAAQGRASANIMADRVRSLFKMDADLTHAYHHDLAGGKWNHMMSQTHIGYTYWQQPEQNSMPEVVNITVPGEAEMGLAVEGSELAWPGSATLPVLPVFEKPGDQDYFVEVFNRGAEPFECTITPSEAWIRPGLENFTVNEDKRIRFQVDWEQVPHGIHRFPVEISGTGMTVTLYVRTDKRDLPADLPAGTFVESNGSVSMEAAHFQKAIGSGDIIWETVPNLGKTHSAVISMPVTAGESVPGERGPRLEYQVCLRDTGRVVMMSYLSPTLNFHHTDGLRFAVSIDDGIPQTVNMHDPDNPDLWNNWVANNVIVKSTEHHITKPGLHTLKFWRIDPGIVLQKIVLQTSEGLPHVYLGPPESPRISP